MKILFFIDSLRVGGKERRMVELLNSLSAYSDIDIRIVVMSKENHFKFLLNPNIKIIYLIRKKKYDSSIFYNFYKICKKYRPDIIHTWDRMTTIYAIPTTKSLNIKLLNGLITNAFQYKKFSRDFIFNKFTFYFSDFILSNSLAGLAAHGAPRSKSTYIHNGFNFSRIVDLQKLEILKKRLNINTKFIVGMVATFSNKKDYNTYLTVAQSILDERQDVTFLSLGNGTDSKEAVSLISNHINYFRFLGKISDVESYVNIMDICVLCSFTEGISNSILEYMALGKPVVATSGGGTQEIIMNGESGFLIKPQDSQALYEKINFLLENPQIGKLMGESGKNRIKNHFSINSMTESYIEICRIINLNG